MSAPGVANNPARNNPTTAIAFILIGMICISFNDTMIKQLSGAYPLHEMVFVRSVIGILVSLLIVQFEGGFTILRTSTPFLHLLRGLLVVFANMSYFTALAVLPLADATALFFVAPLFITLLSIPLLGEQVGWRRISACLVGFAGVLVMVRPGGNIAEQVDTWLVLLLPVIAAMAYALMQIMTRRLGITSKPSAMAVYIQLTFITVAAGFGLVAGDGRFAEGLTDESLIFLLRAWEWPAEGDRWLFLALGVNSGAIGYSLSKAYASADAATVAPFEYVALPLAILWGWSLWGEVPGPSTLIGIALIVASGLYVFLRERVRNAPVAANRPYRRY